MRGRRQEFDSLGPASDGSASTVTIVPDMMSKTGMKG